MEKEVLRKIYTDRLKVVKVSMECLKRSLKSFRGEKESLEKRLRELDDGDGAQD